MNTTTNNNNNNNATLSLGYSCSFDKAEFYEENGLCKGSKKDRKSHKTKDLEKIEERKKRTKDPQYAKDQASIKGITIKPTVTNLCHNRKLSDPANETQKMLLTGYTEHLLGEEDGLNEPETSDSEVVVIPETTPTMTLSEYELRKYIYSNISLRQRSGFSFKEWCAYQDYGMNYTLKTGQPLVNITSAEVDCLLLQFDATEKKRKIYEGQSQWENYGLSFEDWCKHQENTANLVLMADPLSLSPEDYKFLLIQTETYRIQKQVQQKKLTGENDTNDWWIQRGTTIRYKGDEDEEDDENNDSDSDSESYVASKYVDEDDFETWNQSMIDDDDCNQWLMTMSASKNLKPGINQIIIDDDDCDEE
jgi:hypothetical protein